MISTNFIPIGIFLYIWIELRTMIYITQLIYIKKGQESAFHAFEDLAIPIISKYNGRITLRVRPKPNEILALEGEPPYEIHLVEFDSSADFEAFKLDEERKAFLHLKEQSIRASLLIQGERIG